MCAAVALGLDPIFMRHQMGLVRWDVDLELSDLELSDIEQVNPGWVALVEELNRLIAERPPYCVVEGSR